MNRRALSAAFDEHILAWGMVLSFATACADGDGHRRNSPDGEGPALSNLLYTFPLAFIENISPLPNDRLLLTTMDPAGLFVLESNASEPKPEEVVSFDFDTNITGLTGMVQLPSTNEGEILYAVGGGLHTIFSFERGSMYLFVVSLNTRAIIDQIPVPDTALMNGMATLPSDPHVVLSADSIDGRILAIDTRTKKVSVLLQDEALAPKEGASPQIGINGLRTSGEYLYFTNSSYGTLSRIRIDKSGNPVDGIEVLGRSPAAEQIYDDFALDSHGTAYIAVHSSSVAKMTIDGQHQTVAGGVGDGLFQDPTSVAISNDSKSLYVSTGGLFLADPKQGGQVIKVQLE